jgi:ABC-2 type transport system permease protein
MREATVILRRELKSYFLSPIAYVFGVLLLGLHLYLSAEQILNHGNQASMQGFFSWLPILFLFFLPALTMRLWAEERKLGTIELLLTFPVKTSQLIAGKFLAALVYLAVLLVLTLGFPITLASFGRLDWGPVLAAYLATMLMSAAYLSLGMFCSSVTRDQIVALLLAMVSLVALFLVGLPQFLLQLGQVLPDWWIGILGAISPYRYFSSIARGVLDTGDLIYYASFCAFFLYLNALVLQGRRMKG